MSTGYINRMKDCPAGHQYSAELGECPFCKPGDNFAESDKTVAAYHDDDQYTQKTMRYQQNPQDDDQYTEKTAKYQAPHISEGENDERTVIFRTGNKEEKVNPVVGWLVCIDGPDKGKSYQIYSDHNNIGRDPDPKNTISITGDKGISRIKQALIIYDPRSRSFYLANNEGRTNNYINGNLLIQNCKLTAYDCIEMGQSKLLFVPFCGDQFSWE